MLAVSSCQTRYNRITAFAATAEQVRQGHQVDPVYLWRNRADALAQRATELKNLANAWQPLYQSLDADQKKRMRVPALAVIRQMGDAVDARRKEMYLRGGRRGIETPIGRSPRSVCKAARFCEGVQCAAGCWIRKIRSRMPATHQSPTDKKCMHQFPARLANSTRTGLQNLKISPNFLLVRSVRTAVSVVLEHHD